MNLYLILESPGLGWDWAGETPTAGDSPLGGRSLVRGGLSILQFPAALDLPVLPHLRLLKNIQPAASFGAPGPSLPLLWLSARGRSENFGKRETPKLRTLGEGSEEKGGALGTKREEKREMRG